MAKLTPVKAIRKKCLDCCAGQREEVRLCPCVDCPLHEYRMGHRPAKSGGFSVEEYVGAEILDEVKKIEKNVRRLTISDVESDCNDDAEE